MSKVSLMIDEMKDAGQDFEWYPTTQEIIDAVAVDLYRQIDKNGKGFRFIPSSILDVGAGDGRVLTSLAEKLEKIIDDETSFKADNASLLAIEKSRPLIETMPDRIGIVGTDFLQQNIGFTKTRVIFSNPPYSIFRDWTVKLIREANTFIAYLVIPQRWRMDERIQDALRARKATAEVVDSFDFTKGERAARAKVDLVRIAFVDINDWEAFYYHYERDTLSKTDPFHIWFEETFGEAPAADADEVKAEYELKEEKRKRIREKTALVKGASIVETLAELYRDELARLGDTYHKIMSLDPDVLAELKADLSGLESGLRSRLLMLKQVYWQELFDRLDKLTGRLTTGTRKRMLGILESRNHLDFTEDNAYAIVIWAIKNANKYYDEQIVEVFDSIAERADKLSQYKSNQKLFAKQNWRYMKDTPHKLEYRMVLQFYTAITTSAWGGHNGLEHVVHDFLSDLLIVANNLGFSSHMTLSPRQRQWSSGKVEEFWATYRGEERLLMRVKAYKNGNVHIQFDQDFIRRLNVEAGRLKGWIHNAQQAADEMDITQEEAEICFGSNYKIEAKNALPRLL